MKKILIVSLMGSFFLWSGIVYADSGRSFIVGRANVLDLGMGLMREMVYTSDTPFTGEMDRSNFSTYPERWINDDNPDTFDDTLKDLAGYKAWHNNSSLRTLFTGLGLENSVSKKQKWELVVDMGVAVQIPPEVEMTTAGSIVLNSHSDETLVKGEKQFEGQLGNFKYHPVLTFGLKYNF